MGKSHPPQRKQQSTTSSKAKKAHGPSNQPEPIQDEYSVSFPSFDSLPQTSSSSSSTTNAASSAFDAMKMTLLGNSTLTHEDDDQADNNNNNSNNKKKTKKPSTKQSTDAAGDGSNETKQFLEDKLAIVDENEDGSNNNNNKKKNTANSNKQVYTFESMKLTENLLKAIKKKGFRYPTPIQRQCIPLIMAGRDVVAMARTGSGKTAAFVVPMIQGLRDHSGTVGARALIIAPTRELVLQTFKVCIHLAKGTDLRVCAIVGGSAMDKQFSDLANNPDIIVATPGRLLHIMEETGVSLKRLEYLVFDEADRLFELGLKFQLHQLLSKIPSTRLTALVSATLPTELVDFVKVGLSNPEFVRLDAESKISSELTTSFFTCKTQEKEAALVYILREFVRPTDLTIIFACTRHHCEYLQSMFAKCNIESVVVYGSMEQEARQLNLNRFRNKQVHILITTDLAARGIDIPMLENVINFDFPASPKLFIHRVGRAARAGRTGTAFSVVSTDEVPYMIDLFTFLGLPLRNQPIEDDATDTTDNDAATAAEGDVAVSSSKKKKNAVLPLSIKLLRKYDGYYGSLPQSVLDERCEDVVKMINNDDDCIAQRTSCEKAYTLYVRSRPSAAKNSVGMAKDLKRSVHPLIMELMSKEQKGEFERMKQQMNLVDRIKLYRPHVTVFEGDLTSDSAKVMDERRRFRDVHMAFKTTKAKKSDGDSDDEEQHELDRPLDEQEQLEKPKTLAETLLRSARKRHNDEFYTMNDDDGEDGKREDKDDMSREKKKRRTFKDEQFYISYEPEQGFLNKKEVEERGYAVNRQDDDIFHNAMKDAALDIGGDENDDIMKRRTVTKWDKKSGKYIKYQLNPGERIGANMKVKNEAGVMVKKGDTPNIYAQWKRKTRDRIQLVGEREEQDRAFRGSFDREDEHVVEFADDNEDGSGRKGKKGPENKKDMRSSTSRDFGIKTPQQLVKERTKEKKKKDNVEVVERIKQHGWKKVKQDFFNTNMKRRVDDVKAKQDKYRDIKIKKRAHLKGGRKK